jgi:putative transposase
MQLGDEQRFRLLIHDRDSKFGGAFDEVFRSEGVRVIRTPVRSPNANAYAERWVRTVREECLDRLLIVGRRHLERVLPVYVTHYNAHRPHRALGLAPPDHAGPVPPSPLPVNVECIDLLGGLVHEYRAAA